MPEWVIWALVAVALAAGEIFTPGLFFLGPVAVAAVAAMIVAAAGLGVAAQLIVFVGGSIATLVVIRPIARRHIRLPEISRTGTDALVGQRALVLKRVDSNGGRVRIGGEEWTARAYVDDGVYEPGTRVEVVKIEGATALVYE